MLVHLDNGRHAPSYVDTAVALARRVSARLIGAYLVPFGDMSPTLAALLPDELVTRRLREASEAQRAAKLVFDEAASRGGVERIEWRAPAGDPVRALVAQGRCTDLVVLGQRDDDDPLAGFARELVTEALFGLGRPILVVPYAGAHPTPGARVLIATNGGREAARAIADAMPIIEHASEVRVLVGAPEEAIDWSGYADVADLLGGWLRDHDVEPVIERYGAERGDHGEWLLSRVADYGSDLVVMGGYGHARVREMVLGGMTRTILRSMTVPVLMSH